MGMKFLYKIPAIIYRSFEDRGKDIPHFRALITMVFSLYMPAFYITMIFDGMVNYIMPPNAENDSSIKFLYAILYFALLSKVVKITCTIEAGFYSALVAPNPFRAMSLR